MTSPTSALATPTSTTSSSSSSCGALTFEIPVSDAACAMPYGDSDATKKNHTDILSACCGDRADVISYRGDCGIYCLALDQSVADLTACLYDHGAAWGDVFCSQNSTATATATGGGLPAATVSGVGASVVVTAGAEKTSGAGGDGDDDSDGDGDSGSDGDGDGDETASGDAPSGSEGAAARGVRPEFGGAKAGLVVGALLFCATAFGALQL